jgi:hypothetical protein
MDGDTDINVKAVLRQLRGEIFNSKRKNPVLALLSKTGAP